MKVSTLQLFNNTTYLSYEYSDSIDASKTEKLADLALEACGRGDTTELMTFRAKVQMAEEGEVIRRTE